MRGEEAANYSVVEKAEAVTVDSNSTITIIIAALVAVLSIGIAINQVNSFATTTSDHSDRSQVQSVISSIQQECERLEQQGELQYSTSTQLELRTTGFDIDESNDEFIFDPENENDRMSVDCSEPVSFDSNLVGDHDVPSGDHHVSIRDAGGEIQVTFR
jgi:hypothetical protein